eukprot:TRINITY_DN7022_c0_g1_i12.p1 TRINITY_DN7022_c0_g1~~TRINITY_DN7022_c0_g1_i12.p1  ORF type:complete len:373 (-),score=59.71 TRINITY_DN7022_c0_g1_i12:504-1622(-)
MDRYQIICLQEMFGFLSYRKSKLINKAIKKGFVYVASTPDPSFFDKFLIDAGLLVLSKYPIVEQEFKPYTFGVLSDALSQKGMLYCKIAIPNLEEIHLFTTHTQASYQRLPLRTMRSTVLTRLQQLFHFRKFLETTLKKHMRSLRELVVIVGDFNVNAKEETLVSDLLGEDSFILENEFNLPHSFLRRREYEILTDLLSFGGRDKLYDLGRIANGGSFPVTYGESERVGGVEMPVEVALTHRDDLCSNQCLDYMFQLIPLHLLRTEPEVIIADEEGKGEEPERHLFDSIATKGTPTQFINNSNLDPGNSFMREDADFVHYGFDHTSVHLERFAVTHEEFTHISDHYGLELTLRKKFLVKEKDYPPHLDIIFD